jgi:hypothetical protein
LRVISVVFAAIGHYWAAMAVVIAALVTLLAAQWSA